MATPPFAALLRAGYHKRCAKPFCALCYLQDHAACAAACAAAAADEDAEQPPPPSLTPVIARIKRLGSQFAPGRQEDAHDFVHALLDSCHVALLDDAGGEASYDGATAATSAVYHVFGGAVRSAVRCRKCSGVSATHESFLTLPLEVAGRGIGSVEDALAASLAGGEDLKGGNAYRCEACADLTPARKAARLAAAPNALALALKRYSGGFFGKINKRVVYGATLDASRFLARHPPPAPSGEAAPAEAAADVADARPPPATYRLCGVVVHHDWALSTSAGHYVAFVRRGGSWWKCDDSVITPCSEAVALNQTAYMLFYVAEAPRPPPAVRPADQEDSPEELAEAAARLQAAARRRAAVEALEAELQVVPQHKLTRDGDQPAPELLRDGRAEPEARWPASLTLSIELPACKRARDFGVTVETQNFELVSAIGRYRMVSHLPYPVNEDYQGTFDINTGVLKLKMEVLQLPRDLPPGDEADADPASPPPPPPPPPKPLRTEARLAVRAARVARSEAEKAADKIAALRVAD
jgi:ubiquitin carboxyl-terminal hydrolase 36/42